MLFSSTAMLSGLAPAARAAPSRPRSTSAAVGCSAAQSTIGMPCWTGTGMPAPERTMTWWFGFSFSVYPIRRKINVPPSPSMTLVIFSSVARTRSSSAVSSVGSRGGAAAAAAPREPSADWSLAASRLAGLSSTSVPSCSRTAYRPRSSLHVSAVPRVPLSSGRPASPLMSTRLPVSAPVLAGLGSSVSTVPEPSALIATSRSCCSHAEPASWVGGAPRSVPS